MRELASMALEKWKEAGHPGWAVTGADSTDLLGELERFQVLCCAVLCWLVLAITMLRIIHCPACTLNGWLFTCMRLNTVQPPSHQT